MEQIIEFFGGLFATDLWPPRWNCGVWTDFHGWMYIGSDLAIFLAYFVIPVVIAKLVRNKGDIPASNVLYWFVAFIMFCGLTHLLDALIFWAPLYRLAALLKLGTAIVSWVTVAKVIKIYPDLLALRTGKEYQKELDQRRKAEKELSIHTATLERTVKDLEQFAYVSSHDLQEPLNTIKSYVSIMETDIGPKLNDEEKMYLKFTVEAAHRMQDLLKDLLAYSKLGKQSDAGKYDMNEILDGILLDIQVKLKETKAEVLYGNLPTIYGSKIELHLLFQNLITNGIKFKRSKTVAKVEITAKDRGDDFLFVVKDNGIGIHKKYEGRIFQIFQRLHNRTEYQGNGVGLSICKKIVESSGGRIWFEDNDPGTKFMFTWPKGKK